MQLVAYGAQDIYLTGNPQITFFKIVYRRYTNFAIETIEQSFVGTIRFGNKVTAKIPTSGDLMNKVYVKIIVNSVTVPSANRFAWVKRLGHAIIDRAELDISGTIIDRHYGTWLDVWYELARNSNHDSGYAALIGDVDELTAYNNISKPEYTLYIPLQFWFNRYIGLSIPLIAIQYGTVCINIYLANKNNLMIMDTSFDNTNIEIKDASLLINYVYLDSDERKRFAQVGHEYLVEQVQCNGVLQVIQLQSTYILDYNHPTKEIIWAYKNGNYVSSKRFVYYTNSNDWSDELPGTSITPVIEASTKILYESISVGFNPVNLVGGSWTAILAGSSVSPVVGNAGNISIINYSTSIIYVNNNSLVIDSTYGITNKITADVIVNSDTTLTINYITSGITVRDLSIPYDTMSDTRYLPVDPLVNQFSNYGILIDGTVNPVINALIQFNGHNRFDQEPGAYFNYVQPYKYHSNTPKDGINVYSFALYPEQHQPSGTANLSRIDSVTLTLQIGDSTIVTGNITDSSLPQINLLDIGNQLWIFGANYNILRIMSGYCALAYSTA